MPSTPKEKRGRTIAERIERFRKAAPGNTIAERDDGNDASFWWKCSSSNPAHPTRQMSSEKVHEQDAAHNNQLQRMSSDVYGSDQKPCKGTGDVAHLVQNLALSNPSVIPLLRNMQRDPDGRISVGTLQRLQDMLSGSQTSDTANESLQEALNRYRNSDAVKPTANQAVLRSTDAKSSPQCIAVSTQEAHSTSAQASNISKPLRHEVPQQQPALPAAKAAQPACSLPCQPSKASEAGFSFPTAKPTHVVQPLVTPAVKSSPVQAAACGASQSHSGVSSNSCADLHSEASFSWPAKPATAPSTPASCPVIQTGENANARVSTESCGTPSNHASKPPVEGRAPPICPDASRDQQSAADQQTVQQGKESSKGTCAVVGIDTVVTKASSTACKDDQASQAIKPVSGIMWPGVHVDKPSSPCPLSTPADSKSQSEILVPIFQKQEQSHGASNQSKPACSTATQAPSPSPPVCTPPSQSTLPQVALPASANSSRQSSPERFMMAPAAMTPAVATHSAALSSAPSACCPTQNAAQCKKEPTVVTAPIAAVPPPCANVCPQPASPPTSAPIVSTTEVKSPAKTPVASAACSPTPAAVPAPAQVCIQPPAGTSRSASPPRDVLPDWIAAQPHGKPLVLPAPGPGQPPLIFVPMSPSAAISAAASRDSSAANPVRTRSPSPDKCNNPTHIFVPADNCSSPTLLAMGSPKISPSKVQPTPSPSTCAPVAEPSAAPKVQDKPCSTTTSSPAATNSTSAGTAATAVGMKQEQQQANAKAGDRVACTESQSIKPCEASTPAGIPAAAAAVKGSPPSKTKSDSSSSSSSDDDNKKNKSKVPDAGKAAEAARRAKDVMALEAASPGRTRLSRLLAEVEATKRRAKEEAIRREERAKVQAMKWEELEGYLGNNATAVHDVRKLKWDVISMQRDIGTTPPKQLAAQFLEKAEAVRSAALGAAVTRALQLSDRKEEEDSRDAHILHEHLHVQKQASDQAHHHALQAAALRAQCDIAHKESDRLRGRQPVTLTGLYWSGSAAGSPSRSTGPHTSTLGTTNHFDSLFSTDSAGLVSSPRTHHFKDRVDMRKDDGRQRKNKCSKEADSSSSSSSSSSSDDSSSDEHRHRHNRSKKKMKKKVMNRKERYGEVSDGTDALGLVSSHTETFDKHSNLSLLRRLIQLQEGASKKRPKQAKHTTDKLSPDKHDKKQRDKARKGREDVDQLRSQHSTGTSVRNTLATTGNTAMHNTVDSITSTVRQVTLELDSVVSTFLKRTTTACAPSSSSVGQLDQSRSTAGSGSHDQRQHETHERNGVEKVAAALGDVAQGARQEDNQAAQHANTAHQQDHERACMNPTRANQCMDSDSVESMESSGELHRERRSKSKPDLPLQDADAAAVRHGVLLAQEAALAAQQKALNVVQRQSQQDQACRYVGGDGSPGRHRSPSPVHPASHVQPALYNVPVAHQNGACHQYVNRGYDSPGGGNHVHVRMESPPRRDISPPGGIRCQPQQTPHGGVQGHVQVQQPPAVYVAVSSPSGSTCVSPARMANAQVLPYGGNQNTLQQPFQQCDLQQRTHTTHVVSRHASPSRVDQVDSPSRATAPDHYVANIMSPPASYPGHQAPASYVMSPTGAQPGLSYQGSPCRMQPVRQDTCEDHIHVTTRASPAHVHVQTPCSKTVLDVPACTAVSVNASSPRRPHHVRSAPYGPMSIHGAAQGQQHGGQSSFNHPSNAASGLNVRSGHPDVVYPAIYHPASYQQQQQVNVANQQHMPHLQGSAANLHSKYPQVMSDARSSIQNPEQPYGMMPPGSCPPVSQQAGYVHTQPEFTVQPQQQQQHLHVHEQQAPGFEHVAHVQQASAARSPSSQHAHLSFAAAPYTHFGNRQIVDTPCAHGDSVTNAVYSPQHVHSQPARSNVQTPLRVQAHCHTFSAASPPPASMPIPHIGQHAYACDISAQGFEKEFHVLQPPQQTPDIHQHLRTQVHPHLLHPCIENRQSQLCIPGYAPSIQSSHNFVPVQDTTVDVFVDVPACVQQSPYLHGRTHQPHGQRAMHVPARPSQPTCIPEPHVSVAAVTLQGPTAGRPGAHAGQSHDSRATHVHSAAQQMFRCAAPAVTPGLQSSSYASSSPARMLPGSGLSVPQAAAPTALNTAADKSVQHGRSIPSLASRAPSPSAGQATVTHSGVMLTPATKHAAAAVEMTRQQMQQVYGDQAQARAMGQP